MARRSARRWAGLVGALASVLLAGCAGPSASPWRTAALAPEPPGEVEPVFCYRTLAEVACYFERDRAVPGQLVAVYPRPVSDPLSATYWRREAARSTAGVGEPEDERRR
ncbi:MAG: hypothetical protein NZ555_06350 [Geminicoccaceae bacterium]|nr:hypothetical protein [Geminicoccaceae bacterium]MCX8101869.1 hypothetical protein [Geminicoccaceae bacterium]